MLKAIPVTETQQMLFSRLSEYPENKYGVVCADHGCRYSHTHNGVVYVFPEAIYLDDERTPNKYWFIVRTAEECINLLRDYKNINALSLDHDLGTEKTGYDVLLWIENAVYEEGYVPPKIHIHTGNTSAEIKMKAAHESILRYIALRAASCYHK